MAFVPGSKPSSTHFSLCRYCAKNVITEAGTLFDGSLSEDVCGTSVVVCGGPVCRRRIADDLPLIIIKELNRLNDRLDGFAYGDS